MSKSMMPISDFSEITRKCKKISEFALIKEFEKTCTIGIGAPEKLEVKKMYNQNLFNGTQGITYLMTIDDYIIKVGHTTKTFEERLQSYNSGTEENRPKNTNTNYSFLQTIVNIDKNVIVYSHNSGISEFTSFGKSVSSSKPPSAYNKTVAIDSLGNKPILNWRK